jgi:hypothetical protein
LLPNAEYAENFRIRIQRAAPAMHKIEIEEWAKSLLSEN